MACCYIAAFCVGQLVKACHFFDFDDGITYNDDLSATHQAGSMAEATNNLPKERNVSNSIALSLEGLTCASCVQAVESALLKVQGVRVARVSLKLQQATVIYDRGGERALDPSMLVRAVWDAGYKAELGQRPRAETIKVLMAAKEIKELKMTCYKILKYSSAVNLFQWGLYWLSHGWLRSSLTGILAWMLSLSSVAASLYCQYRHMSQLHREAWRLLKLGNANMNTLISLSTGLGLLISVLDLAARGPLLASSYETTTLGLILVLKMGRLLDLLSQRQASRNLASLVGLSSKMEQVILYPENKRLPASFVRSGDQVVIEPFTLVPCDCYIAVGVTQVNESIMTGESIPIDKGPGDFLLAGTRNLQGSMICRVHKDSGFSFYDKLVDGVTEALAGKVDSYRYLDAIIKHFIVGVVIWATIIPIFMLYFTSKSQLPLADSFIALAKRAMTILVSACPCALGLASPSAIVAFIDVAQQKGILVSQAANTIYNLATTDQVVLDKTGTLTQGSLRVSSYTFETTWAGRELMVWTLICAIEEQGANSHPIARAIFKEGMRRLAIPPQNYRKRDPQVQKHRGTLGKGVSGEVEIQPGVWHTVHVGSQLFLEECAIDLPTRNGSSQDPGIKIYVAVDGEFVMSILLQDQIRIDTLSTIQELCSDGSKCYMLTGDSKEEAERVSRILNIPVLASQAMPMEKLDLVRSLQKQGHKVAMASAESFPDSSPSAWANRNLTIIFGNSQVGDGLNDAPSLAAADVGIIIAHGSALSTMGGSVVFLKSSLAQLPLIFKMARRTKWQISFNLKWALAYNFCALVLAAGFIKPFGTMLTPTTGAALMSGSSVAITFQSLRLREQLAKLGP